MVVPKTVLRLHSSLVFSVQVFSVFKLALNEFLNRQSYLNNVGVA